MKRTINVRNITKLRRNAKAISPVIATLLMIAIAVVASLVVYAWVSGYIGFQTDKAGQAIALPSFAGVASQTDPNVGDLVVYVQNVGQGTIEISDVYVDNVLYTALSFVPNSRQVSEGNTVQITIAGDTSAGYFTLNERHDIKVTTTSGTSMTLSNAKPGTGGGTPTPVSPAINLSPSGGPSGTTVTVSGTGFTASSPITIRFNSVVMTTTPGTVTSSGTGTFSCDFTVPTSSNGPYTVSATDGSSKTDSDTFTVAAVVIPTITLNPTTGSTGTEVIVSGTGFAASTALTAIFDSASITLSGTTSTDSNGEFTNTRFTVPSSTAGGKTVTIQAGSTSDSDTFTVTVLATITLNPASGIVGSSISVSGSGFAASTSLSATFDGSSITLSGTTSTDGSGAFSGATFTVPSATAGAKTVVFNAEATSDSDTFTVLATTAVTLLNDGFEEKWDSSTPWDRQTDQKYGGSYSINSDNGNEGYLSSYNINAQSATSISVSFRYRHTNINDDEFRLYFYDTYGNWDEIIRLGDDGSNDNWEYYNAPTSDSQYRHSNFKIRFYTNFGSSDDVWVDNVQVTVNGGLGTTFIDDFESVDTVWNVNWDANNPNDWSIRSEYMHGGCTSAGSYDYSDGYITTDNLDTSNALSITIDFWYYLDDTNTDDLILFYYNGASYVEIARLGGGAEDSWLHYQQTISESQYFTANFRIRLSTEGSGAPGLGNGENVWIDDVLITKQVITP